MAMNHGHITNSSNTCLIANTLLANLIGSMENLFMFTERENGGMEIERREKKETSVSQVITVVM